MTTIDFKKWYLNKFSWLKLTSKDVIIIKTTDKLILCKNFEYRYFVYELINNDFIEKFDAKTDLKLAKTEFIRRQDNTISLSLDAKIELIEDSKLKTFVTDTINNLRNYLKYRDRLGQISINTKLQMLSNLTLNELIQSAEEYLNIVEANNVYWNKFFYFNNLLIFVLTIKQTTMIKIEISKDKKELKIVLINKAEFIEKFGEENPNPDLSILLDDSRYLGNGYWDLTGRIGLTSSPIIGYDIETDDDLNYVNGDVYWFPNYQIENPFETLLKEGSVIFILGE